MKKFLILLFACSTTCFVWSKNVDNYRSKRTATTNTNTNINNINNNNYNNNSNNNNGNSNCDNVKPFFQMTNISLPPDGPKGSICGGQCCGNDAETELRKQGQKDFASLLRHNSRSLQGLLSFTAATLQNHVSDLSRQSENTTLLLFSQVYKGMAVLSKKPIETLYNDIRNYIVFYNNETNKLTSEALIDIKNSVNEFFANFFPLVYHHILLHNSENKDFTIDYKSCLKKSIDTIQPFGDIPNQISQSLSKSLEATRLLLQAFRIGIEVLNTTDRLLIDENSKINTECHNALLKMIYCPKCQGLIKHAKPCSGYCLNVLRGCLTRYVAELDSPWNGYVEGIESLVNAMKKNNAESDVNADFVIRSLDGKISEAIMHSLQKGQDIDIRVKRNCGPATFSENVDPLIARESTTVQSLQVNGSGNGNNKPRSTNPRVFAPLPETQLLHFLTSIAKTRGFYGNLADTLCQDESFAELKDQRCWNGERIAEYTKTVVDVGLDMQKYNPEVKPSTNLQSIDPHIADLVDKLRHVHHMAMSSVGPTVAEVDYMQRDGVDGSGSGGGPDFEDSEDEYNRGSGSGNGHITDDEQPGNPRVDITPQTNPPYPKQPASPTAGGNKLIITALYPVLIFLVLLINNLRFN